MLLARNQRTSPAPSSSSPPASRCRHRKRRRNPRKIRIDAVSGKPMPTTGSEKARWNGPGDRPAFGEARRFSIEGDANLVNILWCAIPQHAPDERVNEFAERAIVERKRLRVEVRLTPMKRVFPDEP